MTIHGVLGIPMHKIAVRTKRIGGGFGGKESRSAFVNAAIAVPAWHLRRPVRVVLDRDEDMHIMGQRHAFMGRYKVAAASLSTPDCPVTAYVYSVHISRNQAMCRHHQVGCMTPDIYLRLP